MLWLALFALALCHADQIAIRDVTVIDIGGAANGRVTNVWIDGNRVRLGKAPKGAVIVDGKGKVLIPGLWDAHFHLIRKQTAAYTRTVWLPLLVSMGITGVRDMGSIPDGIVQLRNEIREGRVTGPRLVVAGQMIDGPPSKPDEITAVAATADEARAIVDRMAALGADFIKVQENLAPGVYQAVIRRAAEKRLPVMGHTPDALSVRQIAEAGQQTLEHLTGVLVSCSTREEETRAARGKTAMADFGPLGEPGRWTLDSYSLDKAASLSNLLRQRAVYVVPTLEWERSFTYLSGTAKRSEAEWRYVPAIVRRDEALANASKRRRPETDALLKAYFAKATEALGAMHRAGVTLLAGTDGGDEFTIPGFSLHAELERMVEAGMTPLEALRTATVNPRKLMGAGGADLLLLDADPRKDIRNTRRIAAVVLAGKLLDRKALDELQRKAEVTP